MRFLAELHAFGEQGLAIRPIDVPDSELQVMPPEGQLDVIFKYGQNDVQPSKFRSVSVGDVIRLGSERWQIEMVGFRRLWRRDPPTVQKRVGVTREPLAGRAPRTKRSRRPRSRRAPK